MRFEVKIDVWMRIILWVCVLAVVPVAFFVPQEELLIIFIMIVLLALMILPLMYYSYYELREDHLYIRMSVIGMKVKYEDITGIRLGKFSKMNNMAFSLDAVIIERANKKFGELSISPQEKEIFIGELKRKCPLLNDLRVFE